MSGSGGYIGTFLLLYCAGTGLQWRLLLPPLVFLYEDTHKQIGANL